MAESELTLRPATVQDVDSLHAMIQRMAAESGMSRQVSSSPDDLRRHGFSSTPGFHALIAHRADVAVGMCLYFLSFSTWRGTRGVYVQDLFVAESERGAGLAQGLIAETARLAGGQGAAYLRLSVHRNNLSARKFYAKLGLRHADAECIYMALGDEFEALKALD